MSTKMEKVATGINDGYTEEFTKAFEAKSRWDIFEMCLVSTPADEGQFTFEQATWIDAYSLAYAAALAIAQRMALDDLMRKK